MVQLNVVKCVGRELCDFFPSLLFRMNCFLVFLVSVFFSFQVDFFFIICLRKVLSMCSKVKLVFTNVLLIIATALLLGWGTILSHWPCSGSRSRSKHWTLFLPWKCSGWISVSVQSIAWGYPLIFVIDVHYSF